MGDSKGRGWHLKDVRLWLLLIAVLTLASGGVLFWLRQRRPAPSLSIPLEIAPLPDLSDSSVAIERSEDEWFALGSDWKRKAHSG